MVTAADEPDIHGDRRLLNRKARYCPMKVHPSAEQLARRLSKDGGLVGLGHYVWNPSTQAWGAAFAEVEVDMETGIVRVLRYVSGHDVGRLIYRRGAEAQVHGGAIMGMGFGLTEALIVDPNTHIPINGSYIGLGPMTALDYPEITPIMVESPAASGPYGAQGPRREPGLQRRARNRQRDLQRQRRSHRRNSIHVGSRLRTSEGRGSAGGVTEVDMLHLAIDEPKSFQLLSPTTIGEALSIAAEHGRDFSYLAGGCDLVDQLKHQLTMPRTVINLKQIAELRGIDKRADRVRIGALTKLAEIERDDELAPSLAALVQSAGRVATPQIRNMGTVGGNLLQDSRCPYYRRAWYCYRKGGMVCDAHHGINVEHAIFGGARCYTVTPSDLAPVIVALDGLVHVRGAGGTRTLRAEKLFVSPDENILAMHRLRKDEILTAVELPLRSARRSAFIKYAQRNAGIFRAPASRPP
jgi:xanthine dehydrogenase YagS FAD-binding subunit